jgi:integrase
MAAPRSTREHISGYGKGRTRRFRWSARIWRDGATSSEQVRRQGFETEAAAREDMERVLGALREGKEQVAAPVVEEVLTLGAALDRLVAEKSRRKTVKETARIAGHIKAALGADTPLAEITAARVSAYKAQLLSTVSGHTKRPLKSSSINRTLAVLAHLLKTAATEWEVLAKAPRVRMERLGEGRLRWLTREEAHRLIVECEASRNRDLADLVKLALATGGRRGELLGLTWDRVDRSRGVVLFEVTKSGRPREVPLTAKADAMLARRQQATGGKGRVFPAAGWDTFRGAYERAVAAAGLTDVTFHTLRHTAASWMVSAGRTLVEVKDLLGHAKLDMTLRYAHLAPERLREAVSVLDGEDVQVAAPAEQEVRHAR